jgi:hypothetical protein
MPVGVVCNDADPSDQLQLFMLQEVNILLFAVRRAITRDFDAGIQDGSLKQSLGGMSRLLERNLPIKAPNTRRPTQPQNHLRAP